MTDHQPLIDRLEALVDSNNRPDWKDVVRRAEAPVQAAEPARARRSKRSYLARRLVPVVVLAAAALVAGLIAPWQHGPSFADRALAAIGDGPVIHAVLRSETGDTYIDLATGKETPQLVTTEIWFDSERRFEHWRSSIDGRLQYEVLETPTGITTSHGPSQTEPRDPKLDPALAEFIDGYRSALGNGAAHAIGSGTVNGHDVTWIEFALYPPTSKWQEAERVAVDSGSSLPLRIERYHDGHTEGSSDVVLIETLQEGSGDFTAPKAGLPTNGDMRDHITPVSPSDASEALPGAVWVGESVSGLPLRDISRVTLTTLYRAGSGLEPLVNTGLELQYGEGSPFTPPPSKTQDGSFVRLEEAAQPQSMYDWTDNAVPPAGNVLVGCVKPIGPLPDNVFQMRGCSGRLIKNGVYVHISASSRELLLAAARALEPIQPPNGTP